MRQANQGRRIVGIGLMLVAAAVAMTWLAEAWQPLEGPDTGPPRRRIVVYGYSILEEVMTEEILPAFHEAWRREAGEDVVFQSTFDSSQKLVDEILDGAPADVAILSNEQFAVWLRVNDWVQTDWRTSAHGGIVSRSPIVIVVRPGNPLGISDWADLARPGVRLVHPDPRTSGGAQWALLAEYGSALLHERSGDPDAAYGQLRDIWANVVSVPASAREALKQFMFGAGDALVTYEQDALRAQTRGAALEVVVPPRTIMSEHVVVTVDRNVRPTERDVVAAFVDFLWGESAQAAFARYYFWAVTDDSPNQFVPEHRRAEGTFTVDDLGGWAQAYPEIICAVWEEQILRPGSQ